MSTAALDLIVRKVGEACGLSVSAHRLRHYSEYRIIPTRVSQFIKNTSFAGFREWNLQNCSA